MVECILLLIQINDKTPTIELDSMMRNSSECFKWSLSLNINSRLAVLMSPALPLLGTSSLQIQSGCRGELQACASFPQTPPSNPTHLFPRKIRRPLSMFVVLFTLWREFGREHGVSETTCGGTSLSVMLRHALFTWFNWSQVFFWGLN